MQYKNFTAINFGGITLSTESNHELVAVVAAAPATPTASSIRRFRLYNTDSK
jgi:hypothetical protein